MSVEIVPFGPQHLDDAGRLVAERQARLRAADPALPARWCDLSEARRKVEEVVAEERAHGVAAIRAGSLAGFLVGAPRFDAPWDRAAWVEMAGHAVEPDAPELAQDLYAAWSERIVRGLGITRHLVNVPAGDHEAIEAWHQLDFGQMHAYGLRVTDASDLGPSSGEIRLRPASGADAALMEATSELIWREQVGAPSWSPISPERIVALRADYAGELAEEEDQVMIAVDANDGEALGVTITYPLEPDLDVPDGSMKLASTTTFPEARRRGVARELLRWVLENAASRGARWCYTDWRTSSLLASRAWTSLGFRRTRLRLERRIDERIAWADGRSL